MRSGFIADSLSLECCAMSLVELSIPAPKALRGGWAVRAAIDASSAGNNTYIYADRGCWYFNDGGGNWACLRFKNDTQAVLFGYDHEYSETYFRDAAKDFGEPKTELLSGAPSWWAEYIEPPQPEPYIGFIYGWDNNTWMRANYKENDGFKQLGLLRAIRIIGRDSLSDSLVDISWKSGFAGVAMSMARYINVVSVLRVLVAADANISERDFEKLVLLDSQDDVSSPKAFPIVDAKAGVAAAKKFLAVSLE